MFDIHRYSNFYCNGELFFNFPRTRGPCTWGPLDFVHPAHPIVMPLVLWKLDLTQCALKSQLSPAHSAKVKPTCPSPRKKEVRGVSPVGGKQSRIAALVER